MMNISAVFTLLNLIIISISARIAQPDNFYGSDALLDGYCDEAQHFIDVFTLTSDSERLTVEGTASDVTRSLYEINQTGKNFLISKWIL